jgi:hypothetical protein
MRICRDQKRAPARITLSQGFSSTYFGALEATMTDLTREDVIKAVGAVDDVTIAQIIGTGATREELAEAEAWIENDEALINAGKPLPKGRLGELVEILTELEQSGDDEPGSSLTES